MVHPGSLSGSQSGINSATWPDPHAGAPAPPRIEIRGIFSAANVPDAPLKDGVR